MTKIIRVYAFPSHGTIERVSGVDFARIIQPMKHLDGFELGEYKFEVEIYDPKQDTGDKKTDWRNIAENFDLIYMNYTALPWAFAAMGTWFRHFNRKIILDLDDSLWNVKEDNSAYKAYHPGSQGIHDFNCICAEVDGMTTTNKYLRNVIAYNTIKRVDQIKIFPNYIDLDLYKHRSQFKDDGKIQLLHFGTTTHFQDLQNKEFEEGIDMIFKEYPNVTLKTVGALMPQYKWKWGLRYENAYGHQDVLHWIQDKDKFPKFMDEADIIVVPLMTDTYTKSKSSIKFLESSSACKPGVWQDIRQYQEIVDKGNTGFLASTAQEWYESIKKLIEDVELRRKMGQSAFNQVKASWQIQDHVEDYAKYFLDMLNLQ